MSERSTGRVWWVVALAVIAACADDKLHVAHEHLVEYIRGRSAGRMVLTRFTKANGYELERDGMRLHATEWFGDVVVERDVWKAWDPVLGTSGKDLNIFINPHTGSDGLEAERLRRGSKLRISGTSVLQRADRGWRVFDYTLKVNEVVRPTLEQSEVVGEWIGGGEHRGDRILVRQDGSCEYSQHRQPRLCKVMEPHFIGIDEAERILRLPHFARLASTARSFTLYDNLLVLDISTRDRRDAVTFVLYESDGAAYAWATGSSSFRKRSAPTPL